MENDLDTRRQMFTRLLMAAEVGDLVSYKDAAGEQPIVVVMFEDKISLMLKRVHLLGGSSNIIAVDDADDEKFTLCSFVALAGTTDFDEDADNHAVVDEDQNVGMFIDWMRVLESRTAHLQIRGLDMDTSVPRASSKTSTREKTLEEV